MPLAARGAVAAPQPAPQPHGNGLVLAAFMVEDVVLFEEDFLRHLVMHPPTPGDSCGACNGVRKYEESLRFPPTNFISRAVRVECRFINTGGSRDIRTTHGGAYSRRRHVRSLYAVGAGTLRLDEKRELFLTSLLPPPFRNTNALTPRSGPGPASLLHVSPTHLARPRANGGPTVQEL